ncbi:MAG: GIY-YIG nuclease family protein, partial [Candidatus Thiodiazotropha sp.]
GASLAEQAITQGIYILYDTISGGYYVGQSENIDRRYKQHIRESKIKAKSAWKANSKIIARFSVDGGTGAMDKMEQFVMDILENAGHELKNGRSQIGNSPDRAKISKELKALKKAVCK